MTDAELVRLTCSGELHAREQLVRRWTPRVLAVCRARIGRHHAAEDLTQETLIRGLTQLDSLDEPDKLGAWLRGIAIHVCLDWLRARRREQVPFSSLSTQTNSVPCNLADETLSQISQLEQQEREQYLQAEIEALPDDLREPLLLFYYDEISYDEIAELLGVSRATVNTRLAKARQRLMRRLAHLSR